MNELKNKLKEFTGNTKEQFEQFILDNSKKTVLKELENDGIDPKDLDNEEMDELLAEEVKKQKEFSKGLVSGAASLAILLEFL